MRWAVREVRPPNEEEPSRSKSTVKAQIRGLRKNSVDGSVDELGLGCGQVVWATPTCAAKRNPVPSVLGFGERRSVDN